jgi:hypothetical protein
MSSGESVLDSVGHQLVYSKGYGGDHRAVYQKGCLGMKEL